MNPRAQIELEREGLIVILAPGSVRQNVLKYFGKEIKDG